MSKAVLLSIRPEWCEKILSGEKTVEIRKTRPKLEPPFKCYIYCTLAGSDRLFMDVLNRDVAAWKSGLSYADLKDLYGWHISDLRIYDRPRKLQELTGLRNTRFGMEPVEITRPPQSWGYVRELEEVRNEQEGE